MSKNAIVMRTVYEMKRSGFANGEPIVKYANTSMVITTGMSQRGFHFDSLSDVSDSVSYERYSEELDGGITISS